MYKTIYEWLGSSEYVGLIIIRSLWNRDIAGPYVTMSKKQFEDYLTNCTVEWSFSKL